jgi:hypothetical protein
MFQEVRKGRTLATAFALFALIGPGHLFAQLSVNELEQTIRPENARARTAVITVENTTDTPAQAVLDLQDWRRDEKGQNIYLPAGTTAGSCGTHLKVFPTSVPVAAHSSVPIRVTFDGPATTNCWGIVFIQNSERPKPSARQSGITYIIRTGVKIYVENEKAPRAGEVDSVAYGPVQLALNDTAHVTGLLVRFRNTGAAHLKAKGAIEVRNADNAVVAKLPVEQFPIAPGDVRDIAVKLPALPAGKYVALALIDFDGADIAANQAQFEIH